MSAQRRNEIARPDAMSLHRRPGERRSRHATPVDVPESGCVCLLASRRNGTRYLGVTSTLLRRLWQRKLRCVDGFTKKSRADGLVPYEMHPSIESAIAREKTLKK
jgi:putative endonuclease